jgi:hypothetical protein
MDAPPCQCHTPGFCPRYGRNMDGRLLTLCRTRPDYRRLWDGADGRVPESRVPWPMLSPDMPVEVVRELLPLPPRPQPDGWWGWENVQEAQRRLAAARAAAVPPYPGPAAGRGVIVIGGGKYFPAAYVTLRVLRHVGCRLPLQLWHLAGELDDGWRQALEPLDVACVDADALARTHPFRFLHGHWWKGWQLKAYALAHCPFREVLLLDADSYPTRAPEFLFDLPAYREHGAVFWPDGPAANGLLGPDKMAVFGLGPHEGRPTESGQVLLDRRACWRELSLALHYNAQADFTYRILYGDKDTFPVAWKALGRPHGRLWPECGFSSNTILQYDHRGAVLFQHRALDKFRLEATEFLSTPQYHTENQYTPTLVHEDFCFQALADLQARWSSWWHSLVRRWHPTDPYRPTEDFRRHYQVKHEVATRLRPQRIAEIGVRAGYSAFAFLSAVPQASYVGLDADRGEYGGVIGYVDHTRQSLRGFRVTLMRADTQQLHALPGRFDLVHVDGDHSRAGCLHDLGLAARAASHVLVDDYDFLPEVRRACHDFLAAHPSVTAEYIDDGLRGNLLLTIPAR